MHQHCVEASHALGYRITTTAALIGPLAAQSFNFSRVTEYPYKAADRWYMSRLLQLHRQASDGIATLDTGIVRLSTTMI